MSAEGEFYPDVASSRDALGLSPATLDFRLPDGRPHKDWEPNVPHVPFFHNAEAVGLSVVGLGHILSLHGDRLEIPDDHKGIANFDKLVLLLGRRFDPLYNRAKIAAHKFERGKQRGRFYLEVAVAAFGEIVAVPLGQGVNPIVLAGEAAVAREIVKSGVNAYEQDDHIRDEKRRIIKTQARAGEEQPGDDWLKYFLLQVEEAGAQARLTPEETQELKVQAWNEIKRRYVAYDSFAGGWLGGHRKNEAVRLAKELYKADEALESDEKNREENRKKVEGLEEQAVAYHPELGRYVSLKKLKEEQEEAAAGHPTRRAWWPFN